ncbi:aminotransferase class I/II-fold pyridoxal phosphate-dependent enzyme [Vibrio astriarenae]
MIKLDDMCIEYTQDVITALTKINENAQGILFVVNERKLLGVVTDGDIRRAFIEGCSPDDLVISICNSKCFSLPLNSRVEDIQKNLSEKIRVIPLVDENNNIVDYSSVYRLNRIPVLEPLLGGNELEYVTDCIKTNWVSSQGKYVTNFEQEINRYTGSEYTLAVSNGTVALHLALVSLGVGPGDEVIVPDVTFGATLNAVIQAGATPVIVDVDQDTWNIATDLIENNISNKTKAIMPVHIYGLPCNMEAIMKIADKYNLYVVEDCAEALGATVNHKHVGTFGHIGTFSFFGNKVLTCGEGGAIIFRDEETYNKAKILRDHGMMPGKRYWHDVVGYNYRLTNLQAAVGCAQFEQLDYFREQRKKIYSWYDKYLFKIGHFEKQVVGELYEPSYWLYTITLKQNVPLLRDKLIEKLSQLGIDTRPIFYPMSVMPPFSNFKKDLNGNSEEISNSGISLPTSVYLTEVDIKHISNEILNIIENAITIQDING